MADCCDTPKLKWIGRDRTKDTYTTGYGENKVQHTVAGWREYLQELVTHGLRHPVTYSRKLGPMVRAYVCQNCGWKDR